VAEKRATRRILHIDLTPFFIGVERAFDPSLDGRPLIIGGEGTFGRVAAASPEAQGCGVHAGQTVAAARRACPSAELRPGDLELYSRLSDKVTSLLLAVTPRVLRPSADEAVADLTNAARTDRHFVLAAESLRDALKARLTLKDVSLGLASTRVAARLAARWARPRGLLLLLPAHEESLLARVSVESLEDLAPEDRARLRQAGIQSLGAACAHPPEDLVSLLGRTTAARVLALLGANEPIPPLAPPSVIEEEARLHDPGTDRVALESSAARLAGAAAERLRPLGLAAGSIQVDVIRPGHGFSSRAERLARPSAQASTLAGLARQVVRSLPFPTVGVRGVRVRLSDLRAASSQASLFPDLAAAV
jgi:DNA polymerase-4